MGVPPFLYCRKSGKITFREGFAAFCASVVRRKRTIRRSLRAKCFLPRAGRGRKRIISLSRLRTRNSARLFNRLKKSRGSGSFRLIGRGLRPRGPPRPRAFQPPASSTRRRHGTYRTGCLLYTSYLRPEKKFPSARELHDRIAENIREAASLVSLTTYDGKTDK